ncbi:hypothetical protein D9M72_550790 [compost metagenome]
MPGASAGTSHETSSPACSSNPCNRWVRLSMFRGLVRYAAGASGKASRTLALSLRLLMRMKGSGGLRLRWRMLRRTFRPSTPGNSQSAMTRS